MNDGTTDKDLQAAREPSSTVEGVGQTHSKDGDRQPADRSDHQGDGGAAGDNGGDSSVGDGMALAEAPVAAGDDETSEPAEAAEPVEIDWQPTGAQQKKIQIKRAIDNLVVAKLATELKKGQPISVACRVAGIGRDTYYRAIKQDMGFALLMESAQEEGLRRANQIVDSALKFGDIKTAKWYLTRRDARFHPISRYEAKPQSLTQVNVNVSHGTKGKDNPVVEVRRDSTS